MCKHHSLRKAFIVPVIAILLLCLLSNSLPFGTHGRTAFAADSVFYDFITQASGASWSSGAGNLPFPGSDSDSRGFALYRNNWQLEDNITWTRALETHPQWVSNGRIMGVYPQMTVPSNAELKVTVGFIKGATGSDGVTFEVTFDEFLGLTVAPKIYSILSHKATYDGKLDSITTELSSLEGKTGNFVLYVKAGKSSGQDWAAWAEAKIEAPSELPDLVVTDIEQDGNTIRYKIENIGEGSVINPVGGKVSFCNALFIDGELVATDCVNISEMMPGQFIDNPFDYYWEMTPPQHTIKVCADWDQDVDEENEQNNCVEETWYMEEKLPDLVIEEIKCDQENSRIGYVIKNIGEETATEGHSTTLSVDGKEIAHDLVNIDLKPGATYESWFKEYKWQCKTVKAKVCADDYSGVKESNEQNNCRESTCECLADVTPPRIISGPTVFEVTQTSARVCWETAEESDSLLRYDSRSGKFESIIEDTNLVTEHCLDLLNLELGTTYHFVIESKDSAGNNVSSRELNFETLSPPDEKKPSLSLHLPDKLSGKALISADAKDNIGVDVVLFYLEGKLMHTDYTFPFEWECDTRGLSDGTYNVDVQAFDFAGNLNKQTRRVDVQNHFPVDLSPVRVNILTPASGSEVYGTVWMDVEVTHDWDEDISFMECIVVEDDSEHVVDTQPFPCVRGMHGEMICVGEPPVHRTLIWNTGGFEYGLHNVRVVAYDFLGNSGSKNIVLNFIEPPPPSPPAITVSRDVNRCGNYFEVILEIQNHDYYYDISDVRIIDSSHGFQPISKAEVDTYRPPWTPSLGPADCTTIGELWGDSTLEYHHESLDKGEILRLVYYLVPVLFGPGEGIRIPPEDYVIGSHLHVEYRGTDPLSGESHVYSPACLPAGYAASADINNAFLDADYLIVTCSEALFYYYDDDDVNELLSTMAELAKEKNGVLGDLPHGASDFTLKGLISPGGAWHEKLTGGWNPFLGCTIFPFDYLLIVGETEIVPAPWADCHVHFVGEGTCPICGAEHVSAVTRIRITDFYYADIYGNDEMPDIKVGRIIGETAEELTKPIRASIDVYTHRAQYDCSDAYLVSGGEGTWEMFIENLNERTKFALLNEGVEHISTNYNAEFYTTKHNLLAEALAIRGRGPEEMKGEGATWNGNYTVNELACWLLLLEDPDVIYSQISGGRPDWWEDADFLVHANRFVSTEVLNHALDIAEEIEHDRRGGFIYSSYIYDDLTGAECLSIIASTVKAGMLAKYEKDIIIFAGHGNSGSWGCVLDDWTTSSCPVEPISFGRHRPLVIAFSCLTGYYEDGYWFTASDGRTYWRPCSIAKAFLRNGAAVYIGATEVSPSNHNELIETQEFWQYWSKTSRIGDALFDLKRWMIRQNDEMWRFVAYEYNLYGDPKFGGE